MTLHPLDVAVLIGYLLAMAAMGAYFSRRNVDTEEYFVGGRSYSGWVIGLSLVGTSISSITFLAYPGDAFKTAWLRFMPNFMLPIGVVIAAYVFLPFFRRGRITSAYEYLEGRFGPGIRVYAGSAFILGQLMRVSIILYLLSMVVFQMTGLSPTWCILIGGGFVALYTVIGGINAVIWTDVVQTVVLVLGGFLCLGVIVDKLPGGFSQIIEVASADGKFAFAEWVDGEIQPAKWHLSLTEKTATMMLILGLTMWLTEYSGNQNVIQRYATSKSAKEARKAMFVCAGASVPIWAFYMFLGTSLYVYFKVFPSFEATQIMTGEGGHKAEEILPLFIIKFLPPGITGLVIAAALAAAMSSLDSSINAISTIGIVDIYRRHLVKGRSDKHYLRVAFVFAALSAVIMISGAIILARVETKTLQHVATILGSILSGGLLGMYMLGFFTNRGDDRAVGIAILCTILFTIWAVLSDRGMLPSSLSAGFDLYYTAPIGNVVMFAVGYAFGCLLPERKRDLTNMTVWKQTGEPIE